MSKPLSNSIRFSVEPRLVPPQKAARRLHLTEAEFTEKLEALLRAGMPPACSVTGHYDLKAIDEWLDRRAGIGGYDGRPKRDVMNSLQERLTRLNPSVGVKGQSDTPFKEDEPWKPREYGPGEWEAIVRQRPLGLNEKRALSGFHSKREEPSSIVFGCGPKTIERLAARGYIVAVGHSDADFIETCKITPEGEAAWLAIADREGIDF